MSESSGKKLESQVVGTVDLPREPFAAGAIIFSDGDSGDSAYVVERGCVEILASRNGTEQRIALLGKGALFGEIALLDRLPRTATARAVVPTTLIRIAHDHVAELLSRSDPVMQFLLNILVLRFRQARGAEHRVPNPAEWTTTDDVTDGTHASAVRSLALTQDLAHGMEVGQLELHYQPICRLADNGLAGFEALVRWRHPSLGLVSPVEFIGLAERTGLIHILGNWVLDRALADWKELRRFCRTREGETPFISVNLSAPECVEPGIVEQISARLKDYDIPANELRIELTESVLVDNLEGLSRMLHDLSRLGVSIAMDDFGTGYSGLDYLRSLPFGSIKIDRAFVQGMDSSIRSMEIVKAALSLADGIGLKTVAEGIEDGATGLHLADMGCTFAQGYFYGRPVPLEKVAGWFDEYCRTLYPAHAPSKTPAD